MYKNLSTVVAAVKEAAKSCSRVAVAIDGRGGAGKSTLARELAATIPDLFHIEYDWFHLPAAEVTAERRYDRERFHHELLRPFLSGAGELNFRKYNWGELADATDALQSEKLIVPKACGLVVEGCETLHEELVDSFAVKVWLEVPKERAFDQGVRRDLEQYGLEEAKVLPLWQEWVEWEEESLKRDDRSKRADFVQEICG